MVKVITDGSHLYTFSPLITGPYGRMRTQKISGEENRNISKGQTLASNFDLFVHRLSGKLRGSVLAASSLSWLNEKRQL